MEPTKLIISEDDFEILSELTLNHNIADPHIKNCIKNFQIELLRAEVYDKSMIPNNVIGINSIVTIDTPYGRKENLKLVIPNFADMKKRKLSVMSPLGLSIIGLREGTTGMWSFPFSVEKISIEKVLNSKIQIQKESQKLE